HQSTVDDKNKRQAAAKPGGDGELEDGAERQAEEELFNDPYGVLARLATKAQSELDQSDVSKSDSALPAGDTFSNPFEPFADSSISEPKSVQSEHEQMTLAEPGAHPLPPGLEKPLEVKPDAAADGP